MKPKVNLGATLFTVILLLGCTNPAKNKTPEATDQNIVDESHNAKNSIDYKGTYIGSLPCADCDSIVQILTLMQDGFIQKSTYHKNKKEETFEEKGSYSWNEDGSILILSGIKNAPNHYFVGENQLQQLDMDGNRIEGQLAKRYILHKVNAPNDLVK